MSALTRRVSDANAVRQGPNIVAESLEFGLEVGAESVEEGTEGVDLGFQRGDCGVDVVFWSILSRVLQSTEVYAAFQEGGIDTSRGLGVAGRECGALGIVIVSGNSYGNVKAVLVEQRFAAMYRVSRVLEGCEACGLPAYHRDVHRVHVMLVDPRYSLLRWISVESVRLWIER